METDKRAVETQEKVQRFVLLAVEGDAAPIEAEKSLHELEELLERQGLAALCEGRSEVAFLARPRKQELFACFNRYRKLKL